MQINRQELAATLKAMQQDRNEKVKVIDLKPISTKTPIVVKGVVGHA